MHGGYKAYIQILASCPCTNESVAKKIGIKKKYANKMTRNLMNVGLLHVASGTGERNDPYVFKRGGVKRQSPKRPPTILITLVAALEALQQQVTANELSEAIGICQRSCYHLLRILRAHGLVHIAGWEVNGESGRAAIWGTGGGRNVPRPPVKTKEERNKAAWQQEKGREFHSMVVHALSGMQMQG